MRTLSNNIEDTRKISSQMKNPCVSKAREIPNFPEDVVKGNLDNMCMI